MSSQEEGAYVNKEAAPEQPLVTSMDGEGTLAYQLRHANSDVSSPSGGSRNIKGGSSGRPRQDPVSFKDKPGTRHEQDDNYVYTISPAGEITHAHDKKLEHTFALQPLKPLGEQRSAQFSIAGLPDNLRASKRKPSRSASDVERARAGAGAVLSAQAEHQDRKSMTCVIL